VKKPIEIILVSLVAIGIGIRVLFSNALSVYASLLSLPQLIEAVGFFPFAAGIFFSLIFPLCLIIGGIGFFLLKPWSRVFLFVCLSLSVLLELISTTHIWYLHFTGRLPVPTPSSPDVVVATFSTIPDKVIALVAAVALYLIIRPKVKEQFK